MPSCHAASRRAPQIESSADVLLVEDDPVFGRIVVVWLTDVGRRVHHVTTGAEALRVIDELGTRLEIVLVDCVLPDVTGATLIGVLRARGMRNRIFALSGALKSSVDKRAVLSAGADLFFVKPLSREVLTRLVGAAG